METRTRYGTECYQLGDLNITLNQEGSQEFCKVSYPIRYGRFSEIQTPQHTFQFNLNGELKYIQGRGPDWPHPAEWLKRTVGNDWVYYSAGDYTDVHNLFGEYYLPCLSYPSNSILGPKPFDNGVVTSALATWKELPERLKAFISTSSAQELKDFIIRVTQNDAQSLELRAEEFHSLIGGYITVLPPDARHVDYEVIPIVVADGCLYNCGFCRVKAGEGFAPRTREDVEGQIKGLKRFYREDLLNYNALFLGRYDALCVDRELIEFAATGAFETFGFAHSNMKGARLFLFASADSLIHADDALFDLLDSLPFYTHINVGLESADATTLALLKKPVSAQIVSEAFSKIIDINRRYETIEVTANVVFGGDLPPVHLPSFLELTRHSLGSFYDKGAIYLSPLLDGARGSTERNRKMLKQFNDVKRQSRLPTFLYLIQRL